MRTLSTLFADRGRREVRRAGYPAFMSVSIPIPRRIARRVAAAAFVLAAIGAPCATAAAISVTLTRQGASVEIAASARLQSDAATAWRVLTDYERYVDFVPDLRVSRIVARGDGMVTVEQEGDATLWWLRVPLEITFEISEFPPSRLHSRAVAGSLRALDSTYVLRPAPTGIQLEYTGRIATGFALLGPVESLAVEENVTRQFRALVDAIERQGGAAGPAQGASTGR